MQHFAPTTIRYNKTAGDFIWATMFQYTNNKNGIQLYQYPTYGMLAAGPNEHDHKATCARSDRPNITHFVPCQKNSTTKLSWSKAVKLDARYYADTEEEAAELYNSLIQRQILWHQREIQKLQNLQMPEADYHINPAAHGENWYEIAQREPVQPGKTVTSWDKFAWEIRTDNLPAGTPMLVINGDQILNAQIDIAAKTVTLMTKTDTQTEAICSFDDLKTRFQGVLGVTWDADK